MRDLQIVPAATFDHFDFFSLSWLFGFFFPHFIFLFFILALVSLGTEGKKKFVLADRYGPTNSVKNIE